MQICVMQKTTLLDYPGHLATIVFLNGCNFRCPFCHNASLVIDAAHQQTIPKQEVLDHLKKRKNILDGVCISGGEPTLSHGLLDFMKEIKELGYLIKLDTNGTRPDFIKQAASLNLLDYVAMDIKSSISSYSQVCGLPSLDMAPILDSVSFLKEASFSYEFRTTVVKELHNRQTFLEIADWLQGDSPYFLQSFRDGPSVISGGLHNYSSEEMHAFCALLLEKMPNTTLRGLD